MVILGDHDLIKSCWEQWLSTDITAEGVQKSDLLTFPSDEVIKRKIKVNLPTGKKYTVMVTNNLVINSMILIFMATNDFDLCN